jgi:hypothetical protein
MDNWTFGITMIVVGMGGTIMALGVLALLMGLLKRLFTDPAVICPEAFVFCNTITKMDFRRPYAKQPILVARRDGNQTRPYSRN